MSGEVCSYRIGYAKCLGPACQHHDIWCLLQLTVLVISVQDDAELQNYHQAIEVEDL